MFRSESEFLHFAMSTYDNPKISFIAEFEADLKRFIYVNNLINRYRNDKLDLKDRLLANHFIILSNCFTVPGLLRMIPYKITPDNLVVTYTFLNFLNLDTSNKYLDLYLLDILNDK